MIPNMRPNVFTTCNIIKKIQEKQYKAIGIVACRYNASSAPLEIKKIESAQQVFTLFNEYSNIATYAIAMEQNVPCEMYVIDVNENDLNQYKQAIDLLLKQENIYCVISDFNPPELISHMKARLEDDNFCVSQKLCVCNANQSQDVLLTAKAANCSRMLIAYPNIALPFREADVANALLAAAITKGDFLKSNLTGVRFNGTYFVNQELTDEKKNELLYKGVTVLESIGNDVEVIRSVTTKTLNQLGEKDHTYRDISVIHALDTVSEALTSLLKKRLNGITTASSSLGSILTLVICELNALKQDGIISNYERPVVRLDENDPSICIIEVSVLLAQGVNQIYINLNINL